MTLHKFLDFPVSHLVDELGVVKIFILGDFCENDILKENMGLFFLFFFFHYLYYH